MFPRGIAQVVINHSRVKPNLSTRVIGVLKQLVTGEFSAALNDSLETAVLQVDSVYLAGLATKLENDLRPFNFDIAIPHGREAERLILALRNLHFPRVCGRDP